MSVKWDINLGTIATVIITLSGVGVWVNTKIVSLESRVEQSEQFRTARTAQTDKNFVDLGAIVRATQEVATKQNETVSTLLYRMGALESAMTASSQRTDRIADSFLGSVEDVKKSVSGLTTDVKLLGQKVDSLDVPRTRKTLLTQPWSEEYTRFPLWKISVPTDPPSPSPP